MDDGVTFYPAYREGKKLNYPNFRPEDGKYAAAVAVGNLIFISGCQGQNEETGRVETDSLEEQMIIALDKIRTCMENAGSRMDNVIKTLIMLKNVEDYPAMRRTEFEYWRKYARLLIEDPPASTFMVVGLGKPEYLIEIEAVGVVNR
jgi:2-iminobutanoate/2-iminopropanoate deaminase